MSITKESIIRQVETITDIATEVACILEESPTRIDPHDMYHALEDIELAAGCLASAKLLLTETE